MYAPIFIIIIIISGLLLGYALQNFLFTATFILATIIGYIARDYRTYIKNDPKEQGNKVNVSLQEGEPIKEVEYQPMWIKIDKNELGGYTSLVYNRHGTHLTKENREHFVNILNLMILKENELRSHKFKLLTFSKDK